MTPPVKIKDVEKDYIPILLGRVSSSGQRKGLPTQMKYIEDEIGKRFNFNKKPISVPIRQSGRDGELKTIQAVKDIVKANKRKKYVAVFRDATRIARDTENALAIRRELSEIGVPIIALDIPELTGYKPLGDRHMDLLYIIFSGIAETGKTTEQIAQQTGVTAASEIGLDFGVPQTMYLKKVKIVNGKPQSVHRRIYSAIPAIDSGAISIRGLSKELNFLSKGEKTFGQVNPSQPKKILKIIRAILEKGGKKKIEEYLEVIDAIHAAEKIVGQRDSKKATRKQKALHRVTVGYLQDPHKWPRPDTIGNPMIAAFTGNEGIGTIEDAIKNPTPYQPSK
jgi:hypothetical protein